MSGASVGDRVLAVLVAAAGTTWVGLLWWPRGDSFVILGGYTSPRLRLISFATFLTLGLVLSLRLLGRRRPGSESRVALARAGLLVAWTVLMGATVLAYGLQPTSHRFATPDGREFVLQSSVGLLPSASDTYLRLHERDGRVFVETELSLPRADSVAFDRQGFEVVECDGTAGLRYWTTELGVRTILIIPARGARPTDPSASACVVLDGAASSR